MKALDRLIERVNGPYWLHSEWWAYVLAPIREAGCESEWRLVNRWNALVCRWRGHPAGVWFYNPGGFEPDMHCKGCGDNLG